MHRRADDGCVRPVQFHFESGLVTTAGVTTHVFVRLLTGVRREPPGLAEEQRRPRRHPRLLGSWRGGSPVWAAAANDQATRQVRVSVARTSCILLSGLMLSQPRQDRGDRPFFVTMTLAIAVTVFVGFAPTFYLRSRDPSTAALPLYLQMHGTAFTAWIILFAAQVALIASGQTGWHRQLGWVGAALAAAMVVSGTTAGILSMRREFAAGYEAEAAAFLLTPFSAMLVFTTLLAAAIAWRRRPETHKRLMLLATISLLDAAIARWPVTFTADWMFLAATDVFIVVALAYDLVTRRRLATAYLWGGAIVVAGQVLRFLGGPTDTWRAVARHILQ